MQWPRRCPRRRRADGRIGVREARTTQPLRETTDSNVGERRLRARVAFGATPPPRRRDRRHPHHRRTRTRQNPAVAAAPTASNSARTTERRGAAAERPGAEATSARAAAQRGAAPACRRKGWRASERRPPLEQRTASSRQRASSQPRAWPACAPLIASRISSQPWDERPPSFRPASSRSSVRPCGPFSPSSPTSYPSSRTFWLSSLPWRSLETRGWLERGGSDTAHSIHARQGAGGRLHARAAELRDGENSDMQAGDDRTMGLAVHDASPRHRHAEKIMVSAPMIDKRPRRFFHRGSAPICTVIGRERVAIETAASRRRNEPGDRRPGRRRTDSPPGAGPGRHETAPVAPISHQTGGFPSGVSLFAHMRR